MVRHAESLANVGGKSYGQKDIPLSQNGIISAIKFAKKIQIKPDIIITSQYLRSMQTAYHLITSNPRSKAMTFEVHEIRVLPDEYYINTTTKDRRSEKHDYWNTENPDILIGEGAETFREFSHRVCRFIDQIKKLNFDIAVVFSHKYFIAGVALALGSAEQEQYLNSPIRFKECMKEYLLGNLEVMKVTINENTGHCSMSLEYPCNENKAPV
jgi:broad specificity phosphatase PhoE